MYKVGRSRTPQGVRGLKPFAPTICRRIASRTPQGVRGLKHQREGIPEREKRRTPQGVRGLKHALLPRPRTNTGSHSARSAWIETFVIEGLIICMNVALRKECVD